MSNSPKHIVDDVMNEFVKIKDEMIAQNNGRRVNLFDVIDELKLRRPEYVPEVIDGIIMIKILF